MNLVLDRASAHPQEIIPNKSLGLEKELAGNKFTTYWFENSRGKGIHLVSIVKGTQKLSEKNKGKKRETKPPKKSDISESVWTWICILKLPWNLGDLIEMLRTARPSGQAQRRQKPISTLNFGRSPPQNPHLCHPWVVKI